MKKILLTVFSIILLSVAANAQRYAIIDTKYILDKIPEYKEADKKLQAIADQWQKEIDDKQAQLDKMYKNYEAEQFMLSDELKKKREDELFNKEKEIESIYLKLVRENEDSRYCKHRDVKCYEQLLKEAKDQVEEQYRKGDEFEQRNKEEAEKNIKKMRRSYDRHLQMENESSNKKKENY